MELKEYQEKAMSTCMPTCNNFTYMFLNLVGEVGELASKVAKAVRKGEASIGNLKGNRLYLKDAAQLEAIMLEAGDILWQWAGLCKVLGLDPDKVAQANLDKLAARKANHTIVGSGDGVTKEERSRQ